VVVAEVTERPLDGSELLRRLGGAGDGAVVAFEGRVRDHNEGRSVACLHYDTYRAMANSVLHEIATEAVQRTEASAIAVRHRVGSLAPSEVSLVVVAAAAHRKEAFDACSRVIEQLKHRLPLWKREEYADGTSSWLEGQTPGTEPGSHASRSAHRTEPGQDEV
jgi:molybdopterin synthase catalytic subunit